MFRGAVRRDELAVSTSTLEEYCAESGICPNHPDRGHIARSIIALFAVGVPTDVLKRMSKDGMRPGVSVSGTGLRAKATSN